MRTKEEILETYIEYTTLSDGFTDESLDLAMGEYAKELSIGFAEWMRDNVYDYTSAELIGYKAENGRTLGYSDWLVVNSEFEHIIVKNTSDLFTLYMDSLK